MNINELLLDNIINNIDSKICVIDSNGVIIYHNAAFADWLSLPHSFTGRSFYDLPRSYTDISGFKECMKKKTKIACKKEFIKDTVVQIATTPFFNGDREVDYCIESFVIISKSSRAGSDSAAFDEIIINDKTMFDINQTISRISYFDSTILIQGESGTGKTVLARHIHNNSSRAGRPFVTINCGSIPESLIESELFGYASGAFTSASQKGKPGQVELADGGTLFLDEIGLLPYNLQAKFLQLIQEKSYTPVGALNSKTVDVRIISATNLDLKEQINEKKFREDLYYRLRVIELFIPPLRERVGAVELLVDYFLKKYNAKFGTRKTITSQAVSILKSYSWPGNIRELQYLMERMIITSNDDIITSEDIPPLQDIEASAAPPVRSVSIDPEETFDSAVASFEKEILTQAFRSYKSSYKIAKALGITQSKASRLLRKYGIS